MFLLHAPRIREPRDGKTALSCNEYESVVLDRRVGAWARGCVDGCLCFLLWLFIPVVASEDQWLKDRWISSHDYVSYYFPCLHCIPHPSVSPSLYQAVDSMLRVHPDLAIPQWLLNSIVHGSRRSVGSRGSAGNEQGLLRVLISHGRLAEACHIAVSLVGRISGSLGQHQAGDPQGGSQGGGTRDSARAIQFLPVTLMDQLITACAADVSVTFEFLLHNPRDVCSVHVRNMIDSDDHPNNLNYLNHPNHLYAVYLTLCFNPSTLFFHCGCILISSQNDDIVAKNCHMLEDALRQLFTRAEA